jgi:hypothetical protein
MLPFAMLDRPLCVPELYICSLLHFLLRATRILWEILHWVILNYSINGNPGNNLESPCISLLFSGDPEAYTT